MVDHQPLEPGQLYRRCDPARFSFETTRSLPDVDQIIGQGRAVEALDFGVAMRRGGYNIFVLGDSGTGRHTIVNEFLQRIAKAAPDPDDWCYVNNFDEPHKPRALRLPAGRAYPLKADMERLVEDLKSAIPAAFESETYQSRQKLIVEELRRHNEAAFQKLSEEAEAKGFKIVQTSGGLAFAPMRNGEAMDSEAFAKLPKEEQKRLQAQIESLQERLRDILSEVPKLEHEQREKLRQLNREVTEFTVAPLIAGLRTKYEDLPQVLEHLDRVRDDLIEHARDFLQASEGADRPRQGPAAVPGTATVDSKPPAFQRYQVNVIVDNSVVEGAPIVYENHPTVANLLGRIEHVAAMGALTTNFNLIKPGALHEANGGYLILDVDKLLTQPLAWDELKRMLLSREIRIEALGQIMNVISTVSLQPEPIPLDVKVVLIGDRTLYYLLCAHDPDFDGLFKVQSDFNDQMDRSDDAIDQYAMLLGTVARREDMRPLDPGGVARVIEHSARLADDAEKLSIRFRLIFDLLREADYWAGRNGRKVIAADDVETAITAQVRRADRAREVSQEQITRRTVLIDTEGAQVGQVNGLSVLQLGNFRFGRPTRITARVRMGRGEVTDIERQVELGGPLHSKGVLILSGFLGARFAGERLLALSASLVFEQSYGGVDGDSASSTELYALLSALAEVPVRQDLAVTGSVNQYGRVQAIGGVNEKIEGFFDICAARGLTGEQGVLIPQANVKHLMLRGDVVEAAREGRFHVYAVDDVDTGIEILTGVPAGARGADGRYPEGSVNRRVEDRLEAFAELAKSYRLPDGTAA